MDLKYDIVTDGLADTAHGHQLRQVPPGSRVLELGCASGYVSKLLVERLGCTVTGVELLEEYAALARAHCAEVLVGNLDQLDLTQALAGRQFDVVLAGDVLEHLLDPRRTLTQARALLAPGGRVVATIPNIAHGDVRLALLAGRFDYRRLGLLDETHVRFFTHSTVRQLFEQAGLAVALVDRIRQPLFQTELEISPGMFPPEAVRWVEQDPEATTYQFVIVAKLPGEATPPEASPEELVDAARRQAEGLLAARETLTRELAEARERVAALEALQERTRHEAAVEAHKAVEAAAAQAELLRLQTEATSEARATSETLATQLAARDQDLAAMKAQFLELEDRYQAMRRASVINPLVFVPALWRRLRG
ncbi:MAG: methyltransferase protein [Cyanobacteria bacterium RYN_339]|nr:methyltransferase protein [Cyanobacteria bacterium RYN_339]